MGPVLGRRKLTVQSRLGWVPHQVEQSRQTGPEFTSGTANSTGGGDTDTTTKGATQE